MSGKKGKDASPMADLTWRDKEIRFDLAARLLKLGPGEVTIDTLDEVEDTKGNNGTRGMLTITNLRLIWQCRKKPRLNLSIGYNNFVSMTIRTATSRLRGQTRALYLLTKYKDARYQFVFTNLVPNTPRLFTSVQAVYRAYDTSRLYRDLKLRGAVVQDAQLLLLPQEEIYDTIPGTWNLSSDQGNLGTMFITNIRVVWFSQLNEQFNISLPYLQTVDAYTRDSKFGKALVIKTSEQSGSLLLGFRVDPPEKLLQVATRIAHLRKLCEVAPVYGIQYEAEEEPPSLDELTIDTPEDDIEIVADGAGDALAAYYADDHKDSVKEPIYSPELGLAVEPPPQGVTIASLWTV